MWPAEAFADALPNYRSSTRVLRVYRFMGGEEALSVDETSRPPHSLLENTNAGDLVHACNFLDYCKKKPALLLESSRFVVTFDVQLNEELIGPYVAYIDYDTERGADPNEGVGRTIEQMVDCDVCCKDGSYFTWYSFGSSHVEWDNEEIRSTRTYSCRVVSVFETTNVLKSEDYSHHLLEEGARERLQTQDVVDYVKLMPSS